MARVLQACLAGEADAQRPASQVFNDDFGRRPPVSAVVVAGDQ